MDNNNKSNNMSLNKNHYVAMANALMKGKQSNSLQAARLIRLVVSQVRKEDEDFRTFTCTIQQLSKFLNISPNNIYRDIDKITDELLSSPVYIGTDNVKRPWLKLNWFDMACYDGKGTLTLKLSQTIKPYVIGLEAKYNQYKIENIYEFESYYAIRLLEAILCEMGIQEFTGNEIIFTIDEIKDFVGGCPDGYKKFSHFRTRVVDIALREINQKSNYNIYPIFIKDGRSITKIAFDCHEKRKGDKERFKMWDIRSFEDYSDVLYFEKHNEWPNGREVRRYS